MHTARGSAIQRDPNINVIYDDYRELQDFSVEARYESSSFNHGDVIYVKDVLGSIKKQISNILGI
jgi:hypothetical protein